MKDFIKLIRVRQWIKNGFLFFPAFFADQLYNNDLIFHLLLGFIAFSFTASAVYILNDWFDAESDRKHPVKKSRPIASGKVSIGMAAAYLLGLLLAGIVLAGAIDIRFAMILMAYFGINLVYSAGLKNFPILDVFIVSFGFILRILAGGEIADVYISLYMIIVTFGLSMFLALAKRRSDLLLYKETGEETRKVLRYYSIKTINISLILTAGTTFVFYMIYTLSAQTVDRIGNKHLYLTGIFVLLGIIRYFHLTFKKNLSGNPTEVLYKDFILQLIIVLWVVLFGWFIYG